MSRLQRLRKIVSVFSRYRLDRFIDREQLPVAISALLLPLKLRPLPAHSRGACLRLALEELGPIFVKFGQMLSTRGDLLPKDVIQELAKLQDQVPPFASEQAIAIIENALGKPVTELFADFSNEAMASASVAQVHAATLHSGEEVVVKVIRPGIEKTIRQDINLLFTLAKLVEKYSADGRRLRPVQVVGDYQHTVLDELDLQHEGANTSQLRRNFENSDLLYIPEVHWDFTNRHVLTMERIYGIPVTDVEELERCGVNMPLLAERGVEIFFTQVFRDSFFHADMHPGNIFVSRDHVDRPQYIGIDCAIIGSLSDFDQYYMARNLLAIFQRDYRLVAELHIECGWIPADTRVHEFESAIRSVCEPVFEKPLGEIAFGEMLVNMFQTARRFDMYVQPSLVLLQKTLLHIEGLGRELYPELDLWNTAQPFLEQWLKDRYGPKGVYKRMKRELPKLLEELPQLPKLLVENLQQAQHLQAISEAQQQKIDKLAEQQNKRRSTAHTGLIMLLIAAAVIGPWLPEQMQQLPSISWACIALAGLVWLKR